MKNEDASTFYSILKTERALHCYHHMLHHYLGKAEYQKLKVVLAVSCDFVHAEADQAKRVFRKVAMTEGDF